MYTLIESCIASILTIILFWIIKILNFNTFVGILLFWFIPVLFPRKR